MTDTIVRGRAWRFGTDVDTDVIAPSQYMRKEPEEYAKHVMEPADPDFPDRLEDGDVLVAEENFDIGSSREHAAIGLKHAGVGAVIAVSFGRIFYRNAINQGLPALRADRDVIDAIAEGDQLEVDVFEGELRRIDDDRTFSCEPPNGIVAEILAAGGAHEYYGNS